MAENLENHMSNVANAVNKCDIHRYLQRFVNAVYVIATKPNDKYLHLLVSAAANYML